MVDDLRLDSLLERIDRMVDRMQGEVFQYFEYAIGDRRLEIFRNRVFDTIQEFKRNLIDLIRQEWTHR